MPYGKTKSKLTKKVVKKNKKKLKKKNEYFHTTNMNEYSREDINNLPLSKKEEAHESRERKGRHVFISHFFLEFTALPLKNRIPIWDAGYLLMTYLLTAQIRLWKNYCIPKYGI